MGRRRTVCQRILEAARRGHGLRVDLEEADQLARMPDVRERARLDDAADGRGCDHPWHEVAGAEGWPDWSRCPSCFAEER